MRISSEMQDMKKDEAIDALIMSNEGLCIYEAEKIYKQWKTEYMKPKNNGRRARMLTNFEIMENNKKIMESNKEMIIDKYVNQQISLNKIGQEIDVPACTMGTWLRRWGIPTRGRAEQKKITHKQERARDEQIQLK